MIGQVQIASLLIGLGAGFLAGLVYFGGLWWTTKRLSKARMALPLLAGSFVVRMAFLLAALFAVTRAEPLPLLASLAGVWVARKAAVAYVGGERDTPRRSKA